MAPWVRLLPRVVKRENLGAPTGLKVRFWKWWSFTFDQCRKICAWRDQAPLEPAHPTQAIKTWMIFWKTEKKKTSFAAKVYKVAVQPQIRIAHPLYLPLYPIPLFPYTPIPLYPIPLYPYTPIPYTLFPYFHTTKLLKNSPMNRGCGSIKFPCQQYFANYPKR